MEVGLISNYNWGDMLIEIAAKIREHIELYDDYEAFSEVCLSWRLAIKEFPNCRYINRKQTQLPWLILVDPDDSAYRRFYSLTKCKFLKIDLSSFLSPGETRRYFSSRGWLASLTRNISKSDDVDMYFNIRIFDPFTNNKVTIDTPLFNLSAEEVPDWEDDYLLTSFGKIVVSNNGDDDFVVAMTFGECSKVAYWRRGHGDTWVVPHSRRLNNILQDLCFFRGELYATQYDGVECRVIAFGDLKDQNSSWKPRVVACLSLPANTEGDFERYYYLVESKYDHTLLVIHRFVVIKSLEDQIYHTASFKVFKLNVDNGNLENVKTLGNQAIFVGHNSTFAVCANVDDDHGGCKADCIYYTDNSLEMYSKNGGGRDMGIYSMREGDTLPFYEGPSRFSVINPPTWIELFGARIAS